MKIVAIIPARYASTRFPGKPLASLAGKPMIQWVYEGVAQCDEIEGVWVASDDERILDTVRAFGGLAIATRSDHASGTDRLAEAANKLELAADCLVVNVQGDEPQVRPEMISTLVQTLADEPDAAMGTLATESRSQDDFFNPNVVKVVLDQHDCALYFSRAAIPHRRDPGEPQAFFHHLGFYVYRRGFLEAFTHLPPGPLEQLERLEQLRALEHGYRIRVGRSPWVTLGVDCPEDLAHLERTWKDRGRNAEGGR